jgi:hypothetical protein
LTQLVKTGGYLTFIHPSLWRQANSQLLNKFKSYSLLYLEIHNPKDGLRMFKCNTRYDWYILKKTNYSGGMTEICDEKGVIEKIAIDKWSFLPNFNYKLIYTLMATEEEKCQILYSRSNYGADKKWISKTKSDAHIYPVMYAMHQNGDNVCIWSNVNNNGHFGLSKVIMRIALPVLRVESDPNGEYGLSQWIIGFPLPSSEHAYAIDKLNSVNAKNLWLAMATRNEINIPNLRCLKASFWNEL